MVRSHWSRSIGEGIVWLGYRDSNPNEESQSLLSHQGSDTTSDDADRDPEDVMPAPATSSTSSSVQVIDNPPVIVSTARSVSVAINSEVLTQKTLADDFECRGCGNEKKYCHQKLFGQVLTHEVLSKYQDLSESGRGMDMDDDVVREVFKEKYPVHLGAFVWLNHEMFDKKKDYAIPLCLREGALKSCCDMIKHRKVTDLLETRRGYGITHRFFNFKYEE